MRQIAFLILSLLICPVFGEDGEMFFISENGKNGFFSVKTGAIEDNTFDLTLKVRWVDDQLNEIFDDFQDYISDKFSIFI
jgi:hypothetical protein